jgi:O-antigen/teichoic acid export membrane protein
VSFKRNVVASYVGQIYVTLIAIVMVPMYVRYMGVEAYGLVGFFAMLQVWFNLLDMGLTPTMARETARFNGGATDPGALRDLLRAMEGIFTAVAVLGAASLIASSGAIAGNWLKVQQLPLIEVQHSIMLMAAIVALRWISALYRGVVNGFERLVWLSGFNILMATARFVLVIPFFIYVGGSPTEFFTYQLALALLELGVLASQTYRLMPRVGSHERRPWQWKPLRKLLKFSLSIAVTGSIWVLVTQTDKLVLSKLLPLSEYAYFTLAVLAASGVIVISGPISSALLPRMSRLAAASRDDELIALYRNATQLVVAIAVPVALMLACFSEQVLWAWTGDAAIASRAAPVLRLYALGNAILAVAAFPYYLQFAKGDLRLHLIGNGLFVCLLIPALIWATLTYGVTGAGWAWLGANIAYFLIWVPKVHHRFMVGGHMKWVLRDILAIMIAAAVGAVLAINLVDWPRDRGQVAMLAVLIGTGLLLSAAAGSSVARATISGYWRATRSGRG